ncbi:MAG: ATP-binding protein [Alphaproteobacteria bacterium]
MKDRDVLIGKDILELLSSAMYVDPLTVYREYVQNAADALEAAAEAGLAPEPASHGVSISIDPQTRTIRIRDTGVGVRQKDFATRMTAIGTSPKRGTGVRGFRGVGRLAGLGYCRELIFRSRGGAGETVQEIRWDCAKLKTLLRSAEYQCGLGRLITDIIRLGETETLPGHPERFFEVEMSGIVRHRNDVLLDADTVSEYLSQVAPVPFAEEFFFAAEIDAFLSRHADPGNVKIRVNGSAPLTRPHRDAFDADDGKPDTFTDVEFLELPGHDGGIAAAGWLLHHSYRGAIPNRALVKGLRFRSGNIQVGGHNLAEDLFPEPRFNSWAVGEIHVVDRRILPNGRRDHYEESVHLSSLWNHLAPIGRDVAKRCRNSSVRRKWLREFEIHEAAAREKLDILAQGTLGEAARKGMVSDIDRTIAPMAKIAEMVELAGEAMTVFKPRIEKLREELDTLAARAPAESPLARLPDDKRAIYEHFFDLVYQCSSNRIAAKALIDRIIPKIL